MVDVGCRRFLWRAELSDAGQILVIAPDDAVRLSLCFVLEAEGFKVRLAARARDAVRELRQADCIIIDDAALSEARDCGLSIESSPVIVLAERVEETSAGPGHALVQKPLLGKALIDIVERALAVRIPMPALAQGAAT